MINVFNRPKLKSVNGKQTVVPNEAIVTFLVKCLQATPTNSKSYASFMHWNDSHTKDFAKIIKDETLTCIIVAGGDDPAAKFDPDVKNLIAGNGGVAKSASLNGKKNHSKFWLYESIDFSKLDPHQTHNGPAIFISSSNIGDNEKWNAGTLIELSQSDFGEFKKYHDGVLEAARMAPAPVNTPQIRTVSQLNQVAHTTMHLYPNTGDLASKHPYETIISKRMVEPTSIKIVTPRFHDLDVAKALRKQLDAHPNLKVTIISRSGDYKNKKEVPQDIRDTLKHVNCTLHLHDNKLNVHSKYMLFTGKYSHSSPPGKNPIQSDIVWTGTMNLVAARHQYEQILKTMNKDAYVEYSKDFDRLLAST